MQRQCYKKKSEQSISKMRDKFSGLLYVSIKFLQEKELKR